MSKAITLLEKQLQTAHPKEVKEIKDALAELYELKSAAQFIVGSSQDVERAAEIMQTIAGFAAIGV